MKIIAFPFLLAICACSDGAPVAEDDNQTAAALPAINEATTSAEGAAPVTTSGTAQAGAGTAAGGSAGRAIPPLLHGRWGLTPADCTSTRGDAKGLLVISAGELRFYESRAVPGADSTTAPDSISGDFQFTGEGQRWTKFEALERRPEGLVRTERDPDVSFTYAQCS